MAGGWSRTSMAAADIRGGAVRIFTLAWAPRRNQSRCRWKSNGATRRERCNRARCHWFRAGIRCNCPNMSKSQAFNATVLFYPNKNPKLRLFALWYFTALMIIWNLVGHTVLGFEQSWATPLTAIATAVAVSMLLDWIDSRAKDRELRFTGSLGNFLNFLPASLIPGFACGMLLY